jgi:CP family cyanate transporter-like MFS transporter
MTSGYGDRDVAQTTRTSGRTPGPPTKRSGPGLLLVAGVLLLALNLRPSVTSVPSILHEIGRQLGYSSVVLTVVTTIPVLCFAAVSPFAGRWGRRWGDERALALAIAAVALGELLRAVVPGLGFFPGTVLASGGIAVLNVLLSSLVKRRAPEHAAPLLGAYLALLYLGAMIGSGISVPLYDLHHSVTLPLGVWVIPAALAALVWIPQVKSRTRPAASERAEALRLRRSPLAWSITAFMGLQSLTYYGTLSILPELYRSRGLSPSTAGLVNTMLSVGGLITAVLAPVLVARFDVARPLLIGAAGASLVATAGPLVFPLGAALPLAFVLGLGQGVALALALYFIMARAATPAVAGALSSMAQGGGYLIAAVGPLAAGLLHTWTGSWTSSIVLLGALTLILLWAGLRSSRDLIIDEGGATIG